MTACHPRYVRVRRHWHKGTEVAIWWCVFCPHTRYEASRRRWIPAERAMDRARIHAQHCEHVRIAVERDHCKRTLESCEAAYAEAVRTLRRQRDEAREARDSLRDGLGRGEAILNHLTDQLAFERRAYRQSYERAMNDLADAHAERDRLAAEVDRLHGELETARQQVWALIGEATC